MKKKIVSIGLAIGLITLLGATALAGDYFVKPPELSIGNESAEEIRAMKLEQNPDWYPGKQWVHVYPDGTELEITLDENLNTLIEGENGEMIYFAFPEGAVTNQDDIDELNRYAEESTKLQQEQELALELENQD